MISKKRRWCFLIILLGVLFMAFHVLFMKTPTIEAQGTREKKFTSIQVKKGDSLWSIAKEHMGDEVCETNHIYDRQITDGMYLVIPYYTVRR